MSAGAPEAGDWVRKVRDLVLAVRLDCQPKSKDDATYVSTEWLKKVKIGAECIPGVYAGPMLCPTCARSCAPRPPLICGDPFHGAPCG